MNLTTNVRAALKFWSPKLLEELEDRDIRKATDVHRMRKAVLAGLEQDADAVIQKDWDISVDRAEAALADLDKMKTEIERGYAALIKSARPSWDGVSPIPNFAQAAPVSNSTLKNASTGEVIKSYAYGESMAPRAAANLDYGMGDIVKAAVTGDWSRLPHTVKAGSAGIGPSGGFLVPSELAGWAIDLARAQARVMQAGAQTIPMDRGNLTIATIDSDPIPGWKAENANFAVDNGNFGAITLSAKMLGVIVPLSLELVMSAANVNELVQAQLAKKMALVLDGAAIAGDGTQNTPIGIVPKIPAGNVVTVGGQLASATAYGKWGAAIGKTLANNADLGSLSILHNSDVSTALDELTDTLYQPLRPTPNYASIANRGAVYIANGIETVAGSTFSLVGDFSQVIFGMQQNLTLEISREGSYVEADGTRGNAFSQGQVLVRAWMLVDVAVQRPGFFAKVDDIRFS